MSAPVQLFGLGLQGKSPNVTAQKLHQPLCGNRVPSRTSPELRISSFPGRRHSRRWARARSAGSTSEGVSDYMYAGGSDGFYQIDATGAAVLKGHTVNDRRACFHGSDGTHPAGGWRDRVLPQHGYGRFTTTTSANFLWRKDCPDFSQDAWYAKTQLFRDSFDGPICTRTMVSA